MAHSQYDRIARVIAEEADDHLIIDFRAEKRAALCSGIQCGDTRPDTFFGFVDQWKSDFDAVLSVGVIFQNSDNADLQTAYRREQAGGA